MYWYYGQQGIENVNQIMNIVMFTVLYVGFSTPPSRFHMCNYFVLPKLYLRLTEAQPFQDK